MIDPLEAAIKFLLSRSELSGLSGRIANRHQYGQAWNAGESSLVIILDNSDPDWYVQQQKIRLEIQCYAARREDALALHLALVGISRTDERIPVITSNGNALLYSFLPASGPSTLPDQEVGMERIITFWQANISEGVA